MEKGAALPFGSSAIFDMPYAMSPG